MSIFGDILSKIFPSNHPAVVQAQAAPVTASAAPATPAAAPAAPPVDVEKILTDKAAQSGQALNWQTSIVDLMKLLGMEAAWGLARRSQASCTTAATPTTRRR